MFHLEHSKPHHLSGEVNFLNMELGNRFNDRINEETNIQRLSFETKMFDEFVRHSPDEDTKIRASEKIVAIRRRMLDILTQDDR